MFASVAGRGHFIAAGAISDTGTVVGYRTVNQAGMITLRYVTTSTKGTITYVVTKSENVDYTFGILTGTIWR